MTREKKTYRKIYTVNVFCRGLWFFHTLPFKTLKFLLGSLGVFATLPITLLVWLFRSQPFWHTGPSVYFFVVMDPNEYRRLGRTGQEVMQTLAPLMLFGLGGKHENPYSEALWFVLGRKSGVEGWPAGKLSGTGMQRWVTALFLVAMCWPALLAWPLLLA